MHEQDPFTAGPLDLRERPSALPYLLALTLFLLGNYYLIQGVRESFSDIRFTEPLYLRAPGSVELVVQRPSAFTLWNEVRTVVEGKAYSASIELPSAARISVLSRATGESIEFSEVSSSRVTVGGRYERHSVGSFDIESPGAYRVAVEGNFKERMFSIRQSFFATLYRELRIDFAWFALAWFAAPCLWLFTWKGRSQYQAPQQISGMSWDGENTAAFTSSPHDPRFESAQQREEHRGSRNFGVSRTRDIPRGATQDSEPSGVFDVSAHDPRFESEREKREHQKAKSFAKRDMQKRLKEKQSERLELSTLLATRDEDRLKATGALLESLNLKPSAARRFKRSVETHHSNTSAIATLCHLSAFGGFIIPFVGNIVGPLIMLSIARGKGPFAEQHAKSSLNFQITTSIAFFICFLLSAVMIGFFLMPLLSIFWLVSILKATAAAKLGRPAQYAFCFNFVK